MAAAPATPLRAPPFNFKFGESQFDSPSFSFREESVIISEF
jgi:hypothetical protein